MDFFALPFVQGNEEGMGGSQTLVNRLAGDAQRDALWKLCSFPRAGNKALVYFLNNVAKKGRFFLRDILFCLPRREGPEKEKKRVHVEARKYGK